MRTADAASSLPATLAVCGEVEVETDQEAVIYRSGPTGLQLTRQRSMHPPSMPSPLPLTVNPRSTLVLTRAPAVGRLAHGWLPFVFFTERDSGRGNLCFRRYDGSLGLVTPITAAAEQTVHLR